MSCLATRVIAASLSQASPLLCASSAISSCLVPTSGTGLCTHGGGICDTHGALRAQLPGGTIAPDHGSARHRMIHHVNACIHDRLSTSELRLAASEVRETALRVNLGT